MKKSVLLGIAFLSSLGALAQTPLQSGTRVQIRVTDAIKSNLHAEPTACIDNDVTSNGVVLIRKGTPVTVQLNRTKARGCGRPGTLQLNFLSTTTTDGQSVTLNGGSMAVEGKSKKGLAIGLGVGLGVFCWPLLSCLAIKGGQAEIPADTIINTAFVANNYEVK